MTISDSFMLAICLWREARGEGAAGMEAVAWVLRNRVAKHNSNHYLEVIKPWQFSSITAPGDPGLVKYPAQDDAQWLIAQALARSVPMAAVAADPTMGSTVYYAFNTMPFPKTWNPRALKQMVDIGGHRFYREL